MRRMLAAALAAILGALVLAACSGSGPTTPTGGGTTPPPPVTPPPNNLPVIDSITIQGTRAAKEPANFADVNETVAVVAKVHDDETPADQLEYQWTATAGTFSGTGASVTWQAPASAATPVDVTITLKVIEKYGFPGQPATFSHDVSGTASLSLHDSAREVGDMARQFLLDFSDSSIRDVPYIMRNFEPGCYGTADETQQVADNRKNFNIVRSNIGPVSVTVPFGNAFCPIPGRVQRGDACSSTPSHWESIVLAQGVLQIVDGVDWVAAFYHPEQKAWRLCDSQYVGVCLAGCPTSEQGKIEAVRRFAR